jgi:hypothetical protein
MARSRADSARRTKSRCWRNSRTVQEFLAPRTAISKSRGRGQLPSQPLSNLPERFARDADRSANGVPVRAAHRHGLRNSNKDATKKSVAATRYNHPTSIQVCGGICRHPSKPGAATPRRALAIRSPAAPASEYGINCSTTTITKYQAPFGVLRRLTWLRSTDTMPPIQPRYRTIGNKPGLNSAPTIVLGADQGREHDATLRQVAR